ncbi:MAG: N-6 DNA methylase, partial [Candidatus Pacearchaeota archaeon]|nr:N-6 DNA methylase [Candidatus Pacearchaeota archaeon]
LNKLLDYSSEENPFDNKTTLKLINAIENIKIIDPACGSGAFPMGILHKLVLALHKLDPENKIWKQKILDRIPLEIRSETEKSLENKSIDYIRKLGLIEHCIYGVDIQEIAIQVSKLRFFISLLVEQKIDDSKPNRDIRALPNLETKFVAANTLIGLDRPEQLSLVASDIEELEKKLFNIREEIFYTNTRKEKFELQKKEKKLREQLKIALKQNGFQNEIAEKITNWDPFDQNKSADWFDPEWMFGITDGFDIVIGNPPHGSNMNSYISKIINFYKNYDSRKNSASFFIEVASKLSKNNGIIALIIPKSLSFVEGWKSTRDFIIYKNNLVSIIDITKSFENVLLEQIIILYKKSVVEGFNYSIQTGTTWEKLTIKIIGQIHKTYFQSMDIIACYIDTEKLSILKKMNKQTISLKNISHTFRGLPWQRKITKEGEPILRGRNIGKYIIKDKIDKININCNEQNIQKILTLKQKKIISQNIVAHVMSPYDHIIIMATLDNEGILTLDTCMNTILTDKNFNYEYILAVLNSKLASWYYYWFVYNRAIRTMHFDEYYMGKLPIKKIEHTLQQPFIDLTNQILSLTQSTDYFSNSQKQKIVKELENKIDQLVYEIYGLTEEEIKIVESKKEY